MTAVTALTSEHLGQLALFPLEGVALFPNTMLPLHVFEPRYKTLVEDCLEHDLPMAVWQLDPEGEETPHGPRIRNVATAGRIAVHHRHDDGRFDIVVEGLERVRLVEEQSTVTPYRIATTERHPLTEPDRDALLARRQVLRELATALVPLHPRAGKLVIITLERVDDAGELSDVLCSLTTGNGSKRQGLLENDSVLERLDEVIDVLGSLVLRSDPGELDELDKV
ncbi:MAG: LON peptidase substrate-binding domain-containing protein [Acidobacteriota bacterium]